MRVLPILFNSEMVRAILDGRKTVTRRCVKFKYSNTEMKMKTDKYGTRLIEIQKDVEGETYGKNSDGSTWHKLRGYIEPNPPYEPGDILYVRETWNYGYIETSDIPESSETWFESVRPDGECGEYIKALSRYFYKADEDASGKEVDMIWRPSIHMPKEAARIWLRVTDVQVERLKDIDDKQAIKEGFEGERCHCGGTAYACTDCYNSGWIEPPFVGFMYTWNSTIKKSDLDRYGWDANPWVWVIEFERCEKPEEEK